MGDEVDELARRRRKRVEEPAPPPPPVPQLEPRMVLGVPTCGLGCMDGWILSPYNRMDAVRCPLCNGINQGPAGCVG